MTKQAIRIDSKLVNVVQLISEEDVSSEMGEAFASYMLNPTVVWAKFILTDDKKNANSQRIPEEEFKNLMASGIHMPVKMALGEIKPGHDDSKPLGVITHLKKIVSEEGANALVALAALWSDERPSDVQYIKDRFASNLPVNISWEILFSDSLWNEEQGSEDLLGTVLKAATVVGEPAYEGRTSFLSVAAKKWSKAYIEELPDEAFLYIDREGERMFPIKDANGRVDKAKVHEALASLGESNLPMNIIKDKKLALKNMIAEFANTKAGDNESIENSNDSEANLEEDKVDLEKALAEVERLTAENEALIEKNKTLEAAMAEKETKLTEASNENEEMKTELTGLREFKAELDAEKEKEEKLVQVKNMFVEAGLEKEEQFFVDNEERLLSLDEEALAFMIQELKAFAENAPANASKKRIPVLSGEDNGQPSREEMVAYLRSKNTKK